MSDRDEILRRLSTAHSDAMLMARDFFEVINKRRSDGASMEAAIISAQEVLVALIGAYDKEAREQCLSSVLNVINVSVPEMWKYAYSKKGVSGF